MTNEQATEHAGFVDVIAEARARYISDMEEDARLYDKYLEAQKTELTELDELDELRATVTALCHEVAELGRELKDGPLAAVTREEERRTLAAEYWQAQYACERVTT